MYSPYDILRIDADGAIKWMDAAKDLASARDRMADFARRQGGEYVIFYQGTLEVVERIASPSAIYRA